LLPQVCKLQPRQGLIVKREVLGGILNNYDRQAA
jgi:hypothetical protein